MGENFAAKILHIIFTLGQVETIS